MFILVATDLACVLTIQTWAQVQQYSRFIIDTVYAIAVENDNHAIV
jgi:hypothetical protein